MISLSEETLGSTEKTLLDEAMQEALEATNLSPEDPALIFAVNALFRAKVAEKENQEARFDPVTGLLTRRAYSFVADELMETVGTNRPSSPKAAINFLIDIVDFGDDINNIHGHPEGDNALRQVGEFLHTVVRTGDLVCRWGGDEFGLLIVQRDSQVETDELAREIGERLIQIPFTQITQPKQIRFRKSTYSEGNTILDLMAAADLKGPKKDLAIYSRINPAYLTRN